MASLSPLALVAKAARVRSVTSEELLSHLWLLWRYGPLYLLDFGILRY